MVNPADKVEKWDITRLTPYARNSRTHSNEQISQLAASIKEWGWTTPVLVDEDGSIIAGHGRTLAAQRLKMTEVPVMVAKGWSDAKKRAYVIADNKLALNAGWDNEMLALEFSELQGMDFDLDLTGFTAEEIAALMPEQIEPGLTDEDAVPEVPEQPITVLGDVWILGKHRLMCGDSTSIDAVDKLMDSAVAEICFTSPPYADQREYNGGKELSTQHLATFIRTASEKVKYFVVNLGYSRKEGEVDCYWEDYIKEARNCDLKLLSWNVWDRSGFGYTIGQATAMFTIDHEWIFVFGKKTKELNKTVENKQKGVAKKGTIRQKNGETTPVFTETHSHRQIGTVVKNDVARYIGGDHSHPAMFPVELVETYLLAMTNPKNSIYEPFCGSGTTLIAAEKNDRKCYGMELDPKYCDVIVKRWQDFTGKIATHAETGQPFAEVKNDKQETGH